MTVGTLEMADASAAKVYGSEGFIEVYRMLGEIVGQAGLLRARQQPGTAPRPARSSACIAPPRLSPSAAAPMRSSAILFLQRGCGCPAARSLNGRRQQWNLGLAKSNRMCRYWPGRFCPSRSVLTASAVYDEFASPRFDDAAVAAIGGGRADRGGDRASAMAVWALVLPSWPCLSRKSVARSHRCRPSPIAWRRCAIQQFGSEALKEALLPAAAQRRDCCSQ